MKLKIINIFIYKSKINEVPILVILNNLLFINLKIILLTKIIIMYKSKYYPNNNK
uniref:Uncharacterized protein n=1 Tax=viral metagenome TaxID=1070528 RepID=A0A6C0HA44_9ZZZZ